MGSDKLPELEHGWLYVKEIVQEFGIVCLARGADKCGRMIRQDPYLSTLAGGILVLETPEETRWISSTEVRKRVREIRRIEKELEGAQREEIPEISANVAHHGIAYADADNDRKQ